MTLVLVIDHTVQKQIIYYMFENEIAIIIPTIGKIKLISLIHQIRNDMIDFYSLLPPIILNY